MRLPSLLAFPLTFLALAGASSAQYDFQPVWAPSPSRPGVWLGASLTQSSWIGHRTFLAFVSAEGNQSGSLELATLVDGTEHQAVLDLIIFTVIGIS